MIRNLQESLVDYDLSALRALAAARGLELSSTRAPAAAEELHALLRGPDSVELALGQLSATARTALDALLARGGQMKAHIFGQRFGEVRTFGPGRLERERPWLQPETPAEELWFLGLVFRAIADAGRGYRAQFVFVPSDIVPLLPAPAGGPPVFAVETAPEPVATMPPPPRLAETVFALLVGVQRHKISLGSDGSLALDATEQAATPDVSAERLEFAARLLRAARLVVATPGRLRLNWGRVSHWLKAPHVQRMLHLYQAWRDDQHWNELRRVPGLRFEETGWRNDAFGARQAVLDLLARCPPEQWITVDSFVAAVRELDPDFARPDGDYRSWYIRDDRSGEYLMGFDCWERIEGELIRWMIGGPLSWLGVVDAGRDRDAGRSVFRITAFGDGALSGATPANRVEEPPAALEVQPDFSVRIPAEARLYDRFQLSRFARSKEAGAGEVLVFRISRSSLSAAHAQGITLQMIVQFLQDRSRSPLPRNVLAALRKWRPEAKNV